MKKITLTYNLQDENINKIAYGCGYRDTVTITNLDGSIEEVQNTKSKIDFIVESLTSPIDSKIKEIFLADVENQLLEQKTLAANNIQNIINSSKEVSAEDTQPSV